MPDPSSANLGWKLAAVVRGLMSEKLVATYYPERSVGALRMSKTSAAQARLAMQRSTPRILRRDAIFVVARMLGLLDRILVPLLAQTDGDYTESANDPLFRRIRYPVRSGQRVPLFAAAASSDGAAPLDLLRHTIALWPGRSVPASWPATVRALVACDCPRFEASEVRSAEL